MGIVWRKLVRQPQLRNMLEGGADKTCRFHLRKGKVIGRATTLASFVVSLADLGIAAQLRRPFSGGEKCR